MSKPHQLTPLSIEKTLNHSEPLVDGRAPRPISEGMPCHPVKKANFSSLYPGFLSFGHDPDSMIIGEGRNVDQPVNGEICFLAYLSLYHNRLVQHLHDSGIADLLLHYTLTSEQDPKIPQALPLFDLKRASLHFSTKNSGLRPGDTDLHLIYFTLNPPCMLWVSQEGGEKTHLQNEGGNPLGIKQDPVQGSARFKNQ